MPCCIYVMVQSKGRLKLMERFDGNQQCGYEELVLDVKGSKGEIRKMCALKSNGWTKRLSSLADWRQGSTL